MEYDDLYDESPYAAKETVRRGGTMTTIRATFLVCATILTSVFGITFYGYQQDQFVISSNANYVAIFDRKSKTMNLCDRGNCTLVTPHFPNPEHHPAPPHVMGPQGPGGQRLLGTFPQSLPGNPQMMNPQMNPQMMQQRGMMPQQMMGNPQMMGGNPQMGGMNPQMMQQMNPQMMQQMQQRGMMPQQMMGNPQMMRPQMVNAAPPQAAPTAAPAAAQADTAEADETAADDTSADAKKADTPKGDEAAPAEGDEEAAPV